MDERLEIAGKSMELHHWTLLRRICACGERGTVVHDRVLERENEYAAHLVAEGLVSEDGPRFVSTALGRDLVAYSDRPRSIFEVRMV